MVPPPIPNFVYQGNQAPSTSQGKQQTQPSSDSSALYEPKKVAEVALASLPKAGSASASSQSRFSICFQPKQVQHLLPATCKSWQKRSSNAGCTV
jgi:hypothetical protein